MKITDIIGKDLGKLLPPFTIRECNDCMKQEILDSDGSTVIIMDCYTDWDTVIGKHIVELLNERWKILNEK